MKKSITEYVYNLEYVLFSLPVSTWYLLRRTFGIFKYINFMLGSLYNYMQPTNSTAFD